jgi:hypothetical protein
MVEYMRSMRDFRLHEERRELLADRRDISIDALQKYKRDHYDGDIMPCAPEFLAREDVQATIKSPSEDSIEMASFDGVLGRLPAWIKAWRDDITFALAARCDIANWPRPEGLAASHARLQLAASVFQCSRRFCSRNSAYDHNNQYWCIWYPEFLHHRCNRIGYVNEEGDDPTLSLGDGYPAMTQRKFFSIEKLHFDRKASHVVRKIILACGRDPQQTTAADMDKFDPRIVCIKCSFGHKCDGERRVPVMTWRKMVCGYFRWHPALSFLTITICKVPHALQVHWGDAQVNFEKISDADAVIARKLEKVAMEVRPPKEVAAWRCMLCIDSPTERDRMSKSRVMGHLKY